RKSFNHSVVPEGYRLSIYLILQQRDLRGAQVLIKNLTEVDVRLLTNIRLDLLRGDRLVPKLRVESAQYRKPFRVVTNYVTNRVQHVPTFRVHVAGSFSVRIVGANNRPV